MKLAEALMMRSDLQCKLSENEQRINLNAKIQEGEKPSEDPLELLHVYNEAHTRLIQLVQQILHTNAYTKIDGEMTITDLISERDLIQKKRVMFSSIARDAAEKQTRYSNSEIKTLSLLDVAAIQKETDVLAKRYRELDIKIQAANWQTELMV